MNKNYIPTWYKQKTTSIDVNKIASLGFKLVFCDIDNTLASPFTKIPSDEVISFIKSFKENNIELVIISNNKEERVKTFAKPLDVKYIFKAKKPNPKNLIKFINDNNYKTNEVLAIGDQIMTDVLCANRAKINVILVDRLEQKEQLITFFPRRLDIFYRKKLKKRNLLKEF